MVEIQRPWNSGLGSIISPISTVGNARGSRAFPNTSWQNCARVALVCDASVDHSPGAAPSIVHLPIENARDTRAFASTGWLKCARVVRICKGLVHPMSQLHSYISHWKRATLARVVSCSPIQIRCLLVGREWLSKTREGRARYQPPH